MFGSRPTLFLGGRSKHLDTSTRPAAGEGRQTGEAEPPHVTPPPTHTHRPRGPPAVRRGWCECVGRRSTGQSSAEEPPAEPAVKRSAVARKTPQTNGRRRAIGGGGGGRGARRGHGPLEPRGAAASRGGEGGPPRPGDAGPSAYPTPSPSRPRPVRLRSPASAAGASAPSLPPAPAAVCPGRGASPGS